MNEPFSFGAPERRRFAMQFGYDMRPSFWQGVRTNSHLVIAAVGTAALLGVAGIALWLAFPANDRQASAGLSVKRRRSGENRKIARPRRLLGGRTAGPRKPTRFTGIGCEAIRRWRPTIPWTGRTASNAPVRPDGDRTETQPSLLLPIRREGDAMTDFKVAASATKSPDGAQPLSLKSRSGQWPRHRGRQATGPTSQRSRHRRI